MSKLKTHEHHAFEYFARQFGLSFEFSHGIYHNVQTQRMWFMWSGVKSGECYNIYDNYLAQVDRGKKIDQKCLIKAVEIVIDEAFEDESWESEHIVNEDSASVVHWTKKGAKSSLIKNVEKIAEKTGIGVFVSGVRVCDHKRYKRIIADCLDNLLYMGWGYKLESTVHQKVRKAVFKDDELGLRFSDKVIELAEAFHKETYGF